MAQEQAETGTQGAASATPVWDNFVGEMYPFLNVKEDDKRKGFRVHFLADKPRKETVNNFDEKDTDFWFDVVYDGEIRTWTFSQKSLIMELQKHKPLKHKVFDIKLAPVDDEFKKQFPKYKGKDRYSVEYIETREPELNYKQPKKDDTDNEAVPVEQIQDA